MNGSNAPAEVALPSMTAPSVPQIPGILGSLIFSLIGGAIVEKIFGNAAAKIGNLRSTAGLAMVFAAVHLFRVALHGVERMIGRSTEWVGWIAGIAIAGALCWFLGHAEMFR
jgi:hypothetical protein